MSTLVIFNDTDTGCKYGYIHTNDDTPTISEIETALNDEGEFLTDLTAVGDCHTEGNHSIQIVRYNSNGWGPKFIPQIGTITFYKTHARPEQPGTIFSIE